METGSIDALAKLTSVLRDGGPWALLAITFGALVWIYKKKEEQSKWFFEQLISISNEQTAASIKTENAVTALRELIKVVFNGRTPTGG